MIVSSSYDESVCIRVYDLFCLLALWLQIQHRHSVAKERWIDMYGGMAPCETLFSCRRLHLHSEARKLNLNLASHSYYMGNCKNSFNDLKIDKVYYIDNTF